MWKKNYWKLALKFSPFIEWLFSTDDVVDTGVDDAGRLFSDWFPPELNWCWLWLRTTLFAWNWLYDVELAASDARRVCELLLVAFVASPLIWRDSAIDMKAWSSACLTFTSPWYMNWRSSDMIENDTSLRITAESKKITMNSRYQQSSFFFISTNRVSFRDTFWDVFWTFSY